MEEKASVPRNILRVNFHSCPTSYINVFYAEDASAAFMPCRDISMVLYVVSVRQDGTISHNIVLDNGIWYEGRNSAAVYLPYYL